MNWNYLIEADNQKQMSNFIHALNRDLKPLNQKWQQMKTPIYLKALQHQKQYQIDIIQINADYQPLIFNLSQNGVSYASNIPYQLKRSKAIDILLTKYLNKLIEGINYQIEKE